MGGPVASVLLPRPLTDPDRYFLRKLIDLETRTIGSFDNPFDWSTGLAEWKGEFLPQVAEEFGFFPEDGVEISAFCNGREAHRTLGEFCAILAERFGGIIDFHGALWPSTPVDDLVDISNAEWSVIKPHVDAILCKLPGRVVELMYETGGGRQWACHFGDTTFTRAWLQHPDFRMIK